MNNYERWLERAVDDADLQEELRNSLARVQCLELTIDHMTGKLVN